MAETSTIEMRDRELFAAMAMQALITRGEGWAVDIIAKQAVGYAVVGHRVRKYLTRGSTSASGHRHSFQKDIDPL